MGNSQPPRTKGLELEEETHKSVSMRAGALELGLGGSRGLEGPLSSEIANQEGVRKEGTLWPLSSKLLTHGLISEHPHHSPVGKESEFLHT